MACVHLIVKDNYELVFYVCILYIYTFNWFYNLYINNFTI